MASEAARRSPLPPNADPHGRRLFLKVYDKAGGNTMVSPLCGSHLSRDRPWSKSWYGAGVHGKALSPSAKQYNARKGGGRARDAEASLYVASRRRSHPGREKSLPDHLKSGSRPKYNVSIIGLDRLTHLFK